MCLYPTYIKNPKYKPNKKNKGKPPICKDRRLFYIPVKCGCCIECRKEKQREWRVRLEEELRTSFGYFTTLTISPDGIKEIESITGLKWEENPNEIATKGLRMFLERVRKDTGKSIKHWCVTELGEKKDRIHLHGIFFGQKSAALIRKHWKYGFVFIGGYCNSRSVNYGIGTWRSGLAGIRQPAHLTSVPNDSVLFCNQKGTIFSIIGGYLWHSKSHVRKGRKTLHQRIFPNGIPWNRLHGTPQSVSASMKCGFQPLKAPTCFCGLLAKPQTWYRRKCTRSRQRKPNLPCVRRALPERFVPCSRMAC